MPHVFATLHSARLSGLAGSRARLDLPPAFVRRIASVHGAAGRSWMDALPMPSAWWSVEDGTDDAWHSLAVAELLAGIPGCP